MACPHGHARRCQACRMEELEDYFGVPADHDDLASHKKAKEAGDS